MPAWPRWPIVAFTSYATEAEIARGYVSSRSRWSSCSTCSPGGVLRIRLRHRRRAGECLHRTIVVGAPWAVSDCVRQLRRETAHGLSVAGVCLPENAERPDRSRPHAFPWSDTSATLRRPSPPPVQTPSPCCPMPSCPASALRRLAWSLEYSGTDLVVGSGLVEVAGPRITVRQSPGFRFSTSNGHGCPEWPESPRRSTTGRLLPLRSFCLRR